MSVEEGVVHHCIPLHIAGTVQQQFYRVIAFTIKRWEKEYQDTQHGTAYQQFLIREFQFAEQPFHRIHGTSKVEGNQSTENSQHNHIRNTLQFKSLIEMKLKHSFRTCHDIGDSCRRHRRNQQRKQ